MPPRNRMDYTAISLHVSRDLHYKQRYVVLYPRTIHSFIDIVRCVTEAERQIYIYIYSNSVCSKGKLILRCIEKDLFGYFVSANLGTA